MSRFISRITDDERAPWRLSRRSALLAVSATLLPVGWRNSVAQDATPAADVAVDYPETIITGVEYAFGMPATISGGWNVLTLRNAGEMDHQAMLMAVPTGSAYEDLSAIIQSTVADFDTTGMADYRPLLLAGGAYGGPAAAPGEETSVILYLDPGEYAVLCPIPDETGLPHYASGMIAKLTVTEPDADAPVDAPASDALITLIDFAFDGLPQQVASGPLTWQIVNSGPQAHELQILRLSEGVDAAMALAMLNTPAGATAMGESTPTGGLEIGTPTGMTATESGSEMGTPTGELGTPTSMTGDAMGTPGAEDMGESETAMSSDDAMTGPPFTLATGISAMSPGATNWLLLDLEPGDYLAICFVPDIETGMPHFAMGMVQPFTVS